MTTELEQRVQRLEAGMESLQATMQLIAQQQLANVQAIGQMGQNINQLTAQVQQVSGRVDEFVYQVQRLLNDQGTRLSNVEGRGESLEAIIRRLDRDYQAQQNQFAEFRITTQASLERIDRVMDYLMRGQQ